MKKYMFINSTRKLFVSILLTFMAGFSTAPAYAQVVTENPWLESSKSLIDGNPVSSDNNSWRASKNALSSNDYTESMYPPLDENEALGTEFPVLPSEDAPVQEALPTVGGNGFYYPQAQDFEQIPVYPNNFRRGFSAYNNRPYPFYPRGYPSGYPTGFGSGYNSMGGFPFTGNSGRGFPFSRGKGWMPFSGSGFW